MKLEFHKLPGRDVDIRPAPVDRPWMDETHQRYAYRCLPLNIANAHGWEIYLDQGFRATWTGGPHVNAITVTSHSDAPAPAVSHFGYGVLTFHVPGIIRTEPGYDLMVTGPINRRRDGISPLSGIIETDWNPFSFTMNWQFTRPDVTVNFLPGQPFCHFFPVRRGEIEQFQPKILELTDSPDLHRRYTEWSASRRSFNDDLKVPGSEAERAGWQRNYYKGRDLDGAILAPAEHRTRVRAKPFTVDQSARSQEVLADH